MILSAATSNPGKLRDFAWAAEGYLPGGERLEIAPLEGLREIEAPAEDGATFDANARLKAVYYSRLAPEAWVIADDSGLEVDALDGRPGVRSARFGEDVGARSDAEQMGIALSGAEIDERNNDALLRLMEDVPAGRRTARYRCALALARGGEVLETADGLVEGCILFARRGAGGFGYDPLFLLPELELTMAEADPATRLQVSHRARALRVLLERIRPVPLIARDVR